MLDPDDIKDKTTIVVKLGPSQNPSKLLLTVNKQYGQFSGLELRKQWNGDTTAVRKSITRNLSTNMDAGDLQRVSVKHLNDPDLPLNVQYEMLMDFHPNSGTIYMDPFYSKFFDKNPFPATKRMYTVEMDYLQDVNYFFNFELPEGFVLDDYPKSVIHQYGEDSLLTMKNIMSYDEPSRMFSLNSRFTSKTTLFAADDYESLRSFYENVMEEQRKKLIIKKLN